MNTDTLENYEYHICAIVVIDMVGFSRLCEEQGIENALKDVFEFRNFTSQLADLYQGYWVKAWADNVTLTFTTVVSAIDYARQLVGYIPCSVGIGYGKILRSSNDLWGVEVNKASRLGEDVAKEGEILLTEAAQKMVAPNY